MDIVLTNNLQTKELPYHFSKKALKNFRALYDLFTDDDDSLPEKIKQTPEFQNNPNFINLLAQFYYAWGDKEAATKLNLQLQSEYPDYLFWRLNMALEAYFARDAQQMLTLLGPDLSLSALYPARSIFHFSEYLEYAKQLILYYRLTEDAGGIEQVLQNAGEMNEEYDLDISMLLSFAYNKMLEPPLRSELQMEDGPALPAFTIAEIAELFAYDLKLPAETYQLLLQQDRQTLIADLENVLVYGIDYYRWFALDKVPREKTFFVWHALFLLRDVEATESLPVVLNLLRNTDATFLYLGDLVYQYLWQFLYVFGHHDLRMLVNFCKEKSVEITIRSGVIETLTQIALYDATRRLEVQSYLREMMDHLSLEESAKDIESDELADAVIEAIGVGEFTQLYPTLQALLEEDIIQPLMLLDWTEFEDTYIKSDKNERECKKRIRDKQEIYDHFISVDDIHKVVLEEDFFNYLNADEDDFYFEDEDEDDMDTTHYSPNTPFVKSEPKVGRNDPCPCGSGKKFKKCHGKS